MGVDKVILRAFLSTLAAIAVLLLFMILSLCAVFPSTMMEFTYDLGMESSSIHFAERAYRDSDDIYYIAYATEIAIEENNNEKILSCGQKLIEDKHFATFCQAKGENYGQFIYGQVCVSKYVKGEKADAVALAYDSLNGGFPKNNALVAVLVSCMEAQDAATIEQIREKLALINVEGEEKEYLQTTLSAIGG